MMKQSFYAGYIKGFIDRVLGILGLLCLSWLFLIIAVAVYIDDPGPILFKQRRIGRNKNGKITYFNILKFRTMKVKTPELPTHMLENPEQYITRTGKFLRKMSLDELPQLWNIGILRNLSIIGPRPGLWSQTNLWEEREKYGANDVMPGLTGWAQINGLRGDTSIPDRVAHDLWYIENWSFGLDMKILLKTLFGGMINRETLGRGQRKTKAG